jgi:hypothetical protein
VSGHIILCAYVFPLRLFFRSYRAARCRDCYKVLDKGTVRVGAHVFSNSSRHAGYGINYWCLDCICKRPSVRRNSRLHYSDLERILPGLSLLELKDISSACTLLGVDVPSGEAVANLNHGRARTTRSGKKFNTWGGGEGVVGGGEEEEGKSEIVVVDVIDVDIVPQQRKRRRQGE